MREGQKSGRKRENTETASHFEGNVKMETILKFLPERMRIERLLCFCYGLTMNIQKMNPNKINRSEMTPVETDRMPAKSQTNQEPSSKTDELELRPFRRSNSEYEEVYQLYHDAFPDSERKPMEMVLQSVQKGRMEAYSAFDHNEFAGLLFLVNGQQADILDYLAVNPKLRDRGIGSRLLSWLKDHRSKPFIIEIESTFTASDQIPARRKAFYLRNNMIDCNQEIQLFGVEMELLSYPTPVTYDQYYNVLSSYLDTFPQIDYHNCLAALPPRQEPSKKTSSLQEDYREQTEKRNS
ncbi:GNAT family N-acetyltransferase [Erysipelotrichaceae bacterium 51-3]